MGCVRRYLEGMPHMSRCYGIVDADTSRDDLLARGMTEGDADEVLRFREYLRDRAAVKRDGRNAVTPERFQELLDYEAGYVR